MIFQLRLLPLLLMLSLALFVPAWASAQEPAPPTDDTATDARPERGAFLFRLADRDRDREVTREEWDNVLADLDANDDGQIERDEIETLVNARREEAGRRGGRGFGRRGGDDAPSRFEVAMLSEAFDRFDSDGDGVVTGDELPRPPRRGNRPR
ncbi:MAG: hypothetical protein AAGN46_00285 [Acidobacteriota bacterium]